MATTGVTSGTGDGLLEFLSWATNKGNLNPNTAAALRAASRELLGVEAEDGNFAGVEIRSLDVDDLGRRFANLRAAAYSPTSLETYQSRFRRAVEMYKKFLENPATWRPDTRERGGQRPKAHQSSDAVRKERGKTVTGPTRRDEPGDSNFIVYPFPIRKGVVASLSLPADMTISEAKRMGAFIETLAVEEQKLLTAGNQASDGS